MADLPEIWHSSYRFYSPERKAEFDSVHEVKLYQKGDQITVESIPGANKSYIILKLSLNDDLLTGTWQEETDPDGFYKGKIYTGAVQFKLSDDKKGMFGKWVALNALGDIMDGTWTLTAK